jgi:hypothetical protein
VLPVAAETKRIVLLFDERPGLPGLAAVETSFISTPAANLSDRLEIYREVMDLSRFGADATYQVRLRDFLDAKYARHASASQVSIAIKCVARGFTS